MNFFIYNPIAGTLAQNKRQALLQKIKAHPNNIILETEHQNDEIKLTQKAIGQGAKKIIAIGGDGTINKVASCLVNKDVPLGLIPLGSGNGLARHLGISMDPILAFNTSLNGRAIKIDACSLNDKLFFCTAGIGFDAYVAQIFNERKKRGLFNYILAVLQAIKKYKPIEIEIEKGKKEALFLLTIANANQYGNNAYISPQGDLQDGNFELIKIKNSNPIYLLFISIQLFLKNIHKSNFVEITSTKNVTIYYRKNQPLHLDGEALISGQDILNISVLPNALNVII